MESKKRKIEKYKISLPSKREKSNEEIDETDVDSGKVCTVTLHWSKKNSAYLLRCIYRRVKLLSNSDVNDEHFWRDIEKDMKVKFSWVFVDVCQEKWKTLREGTEKYIIDHDATQPRPDFYYVVREIVRMINELKNSDFKTEEEDEESILRGFSVADPDAVKLEPFAGVMDSMGNMYLHEPLFEIVNSFASLSNCSDEIVAEKHGVEEAIVEWVRENQESILRGSLQCSTCGKCILKRDEFIEHELNCILTLHQSKRDDGGFEISYELNEIEEPWSVETISFLIKTFKEKAEDYVSSEGVLRRGIWMEIFKVLKPMESKISPKMCREKWTELVNSAREYSDSFKEKGEEHNNSLIRPRFFNDIIDIVDLDNLESGSPYSYIPKELIPEEIEEGRSLTPRVFLSTDSDNNEGIYEDDESESEDELLNSIDDDSVLWSDEEDNPTAKPNGKSKLILEHKVNSLSLRIKMLEEENNALRRKQAEIEKKNLAQGVLTQGVLSRLDKLYQQQQEMQTRQATMFKDMTSVFERHHKECMEALQNLGGGVAKAKNVNAKRYKVS